MILLKNKSCIGCIAWHGMAYYIFLKSLRSLEEFRKNPHIKIPPKFPSTNFQSLAKFKNPIFNSEILFPCFRPGRPCGPLGLRPSRLPLAPLLSRRSKPTGRPKPLNPRAPLAYLQKYVFFFDSRLPSSAPSLSPLADAWTPLVRFVFSTAPADPGRPLPLVASGHPAPPGLQPRDARQGLHSTP
jgi:hypothetical protein